MSLNKGLEFELFHSKKIHGEGIPLLICPRMLRKWGMGQVDCARVVKKSDENVIEIFEIKKHVDRSEQAFFNPIPISDKQKGRIYRTADWISRLLSWPVKLHWPN